MWCVIRCPAECVTYEIWDTLCGFVATRYEMLDSGYTACDAGRVLRDMRWGARARSIRCKVWCTRYVIPDMKWERCHMRCDMRDMRFDGWDRRCEIGDMRLGTQDITPEMAY